MTFKNFILQSSVELIQEIEELKNLFFEIKEGKEFGIKLTNKNTHEYWISSTNNIQQRETALKNILTKRDEWNGPWRDIFSDLSQDTILENVEFQYIDDINLIESKELFYQNFSTTIDLEKIRVSFMSLLRAYLKNIKLDQTQQSDLRVLVDGFFKPTKDQKSLKLIILVEKIDLLFGT